jgi:tetratricopeptide (TPR) repeat protein
MDTVPGWYSPTEDESPEWGPCPTCGTANAAAARFCQACGRPLGERGPDPMTIDVLTAVVAELASANDAFALAQDAGGRIVAVRDAFVAAGGMLRDLPGSPHTVAAVFGPAARDGISTLTAVRSALAARDAATNVDVAVRVGIGASDVRGGDDEAVELWRGRVVDLAFRLSRMAGPGEVILGEGAYRLIRDAVVAEAIDPRADPESDDVGPLRLHGLREMDAWAVQPEAIEPPDAEPLDDADAPDAAPADESPAGAPWDMWADRFGLAQPNGHDAVAGELPSTPTAGAAGDELDALEPAEPVDGTFADALPEHAAPDADVLDAAEDADADVLEAATAFETRPDDVRAPFEDPSPPPAHRSADGGGDDGDGDGDGDGNSGTFGIDDVEGSADDENVAFGAEAAAPDTEPTEEPLAGVGDDAAPRDVASVFEEHPSEPGPAPHEPEGATLLEREEVLRGLHAALERAIAGGRPVVVSVGGEPGSGRTAAARWFAAQTAERAWTVEIACRAADGGGTSWPFAALVRAVAGIDGPVDRPALENRLREAIGGEAVGHAGVLAASLDGEGGAPPEEARAAMAALLTATVARRPLIVIVDDADRAPAGGRVAFDAVVDLVVGPLLVVTIARGPADVVVPPLSDGGSAELVERLLARPNLPPDATASIVTACGGLPLAVEHLVAMLADDGHLRWEYGRWTPTVDLASLPLPADLASLVARRIAGLAELERAVAAAGATSNAPFAPALVAEALDVDVEDVRDACTSLTDRGILRRSGDDAFSFGHDVLADAAAAYTERGAARAVHAAVADRIAAERAPGADVDEIVGAHLERAFRLAGGEPGRETLGRRAAGHLVRAARGAADVGDEDASLALLRRAAALLPADDAERALLLLDSASTLAARDERGSAERLLGDAIRAARAAGDELLELRALVARARMLATASRIEDQIEALRDAAEAAIATATAREDAVTAAAGWSARGWVHTVRGHFAGAADAFERAADAAASAGRRRDELVALRDLAAAIVDGPAPAPEAIARCAALVERTRQTAVEADAASALAVLLARAGGTDEAGKTLERVAALHAEDGGSATIGIRAALVGLHAGAADRAEPPLRAALESATRAPDRGAVLACLAYVLTDLGRIDEALAAAEEAASLADEDDVVAQVTWRAANARCLAARGRHRDARALVRLALRLADQTDLSELRARTRLDLADVLLASGRANEAAPAARAALRALERKGSVAEAGRARSILDRAAGRAPSAVPDPATAADAAADVADDDAAGPTHDLDRPELADDSRFAADPHAGATSVATPAPSTADEGEPEDGSKRERHWFW